MDTSPTKPLDLKQIQDLANKSLDNFSMTDRSYAWLAMTGFIPKGLDKFKDDLETLLSQYHDYCDFNLTKDFHTRQYPSHFPSQKFGLQNNDLMSIIHGDIVRTGRLIFFLDPLPLENSNKAERTEFSSQGQQYMDEQDDVLSNWEQHMRRLERILYTFATLNTGISYMQGFNELVFPFYYVLTKGFNWVDNSVEICECLAFNLLQWLLTNTKIYDYYTTSDQSIIMSHLNEFVELQKIHLPRVARIIEKHNIHPIFYCIRWFSLLFSQEHELPFLLGIWDSLLIHGKKLMEYAMYIALGHLKAVDGLLSESDYTVTIETLQKFEVRNQIKPLLEYAAKCYEKDNTQTKNPFAYVFQAFFK